MLFEDLDDWLDALDIARDYGDDRAAEYNELLVDLNSKYGYPVGCGSYRAVFDTNDGYVVKCPICPDGEKDNELEYRLFQAHPVSHYARCQLTYIRGLAVLMMEKLDFCLRGKSRVEPKMYDQESLDPYWITKLDGGQIGISRDGTIKAYDFSRGTYGAMVRESRASWLLRWIQ